MRRLNTGCSNGKLATNDSTPFSKLFTKSCTLLLIALTMLVTSCTDNGNNPEPPAPPTSDEVFILNEGNFMSSSGTITVYNPKLKKVISDDIFTQVNNAPLGDIPTSLTRIDSTGYITISGSGKIYIINLNSYKLIGKITDLNSPRHMAVISSSTAYVSNLSKSVIDIIDLTSNTKKGTIELGEGNFAENFVKIGKYVYTNCWSYGTKILKIDTEQNKVVAELVVGVQPKSLSIDKEGRLWTLTDGGYEGNPIGYETPALVCINTDEFKVAKRLEIARGKAYNFVDVMSNSRDFIYYVNGDIFKISIDATSLPTTPFIKAGTQNFYAIGVHPSGELYVSDAIDYTQAGKVIRYDANGTMLDSFTAGIIPGAFSFIK